ncbi:MAG: 5-bromo-4-chloroindolyl phosphate hydrolysis family protein [Eubacteriales bacterium]|nr:5-bromo-4-chloroindolyl phosphate hydrolysis family protein [Eubacteriales bacterium]
MDYFKNMVDLTDDITERVAKAINSNDYSGLADGIRQDVNSYADQINKMKYEQYRKTWQNGQGGPGAGPQNNSYQGQGAGPKSNAYRNPGAGPQGRPIDLNEVEANKRRAEQARREQMRQEMNARAQEVRNAGSAAFNAFRQTWQNGTTPFMMTRPGKGKKTFALVIGSIFSFSFIVSLISLLTAPIDIASVAIAGILSAGSLALAYSGYSGRKLIDKFNRYGALVGNREYVDIPKLASAAGEAEETTKKNLHRMIRANYLPRARFDDSGKTLLLTDGAYRQYLDVKRDRDEQARVKAAEEESRKAEDSKVDPAVRGILEDGEKFIKEIHQANVDIPGESMSQKLDKLEAIVRRIFANVREKPETAPQLRKFMSYYVPTIRKLLNAYVELDRQPNAGENIVNTKREIEDAIDQVIHGCEILLDSMFEDVAWDIASDISVMKTMMEQDGLTEERKSEK